MWHTCWGARKKLLELCNKIIFILNYLFLIKEIKRKQIGHFLSCKITLRRRDLEESIHNENHWPQLLHVCVRHRVSKWSLCLLFSILFVFSERKCISKSWRKLMNYKLENRIPWLFTDFDNIKDFPWHLKNSLTFPWPWQPWPVWSSICNPFEAMPLQRPVAPNSCSWVTTKS